MALRRLYAPFRPDLNNFLFAAVGEERNGIPLSMMSALAQLDLDHGKRPVGFRRWRSKKRSSG